MTRVKLETADIDQSEASSMLTNDWMKSVFVVWAVLPRAVVAPIGVQVGPWARGAAEISFQTHPWLERYAPF
jgi:hypothetical protein